MRNTTASSDPMHNQLVAFLDSHVGAPYSGDVGPLFGQASLIRDAGFADDEAMRLYTDAVNVALTSEAVRDVGSRARDRAVRSSHA